MSTVYPHLTRHATVAITLRFTNHNTDSHRDMQAMLPCDNSLLNVFEQSAVEVVNGYQC